MDDRTKAFQVIECADCRLVFFATEEQLPTIGARQNRCPDCYKIFFIDRIGLAHLFRPGGPLFGT